MNGECERTHTQTSKSKQTDHMQVKAQMGNERGDGWMCKHQTTSRRKQS
ncbi:hypothetical protein PQBR44_0200 (plasmid) [Pseudomonas putida UWC1]|nr:hypothetical protein PQBR44_0200 [Pseudomonas putida UWC1]